METNIILAGVGGQGILSISYVIDMAAARLGLQFKQSEVHGMSQRGGAVSSHLRVADHPLQSDLVPHGGGTLVLSVEPLESLRYVEYLAPGGAVVAGIDPFVNIGDYPDVETVLDTIASLPGSVLVPAERLARQAGSGKAANMVLLGAASPYLGLPIAMLEECIRATFARKGEKVQEGNVAAFRAGQAAGEAWHACVAVSMTPRCARGLISHLDGGRLEAAAALQWKLLLGGPLGDALRAAFKSGEGRFAGDLSVVQGLVTAGEAAPAKLAQLVAGRR